MIEQILVKNWFRCRNCPYFDDKNWCMCYMKNIDKIEKCDEEYVKAQREFDDEFDANFPVEDADLECFDPSNPKFYL